MDHVTQKEESDGESAVNSDLTSIAIEHFKGVLNDKKASDTAKSNAANGLAQIARNQEKAQSGQIHRLTRAELTQEITRMRKLLQ